MSDENVTAQRPALSPIGFADAVSEYERGQRDLLNALLAPNPEVSAKFAKMCNCDPDVHGRMTIDTAFWITEVAVQLGITSKFDQGLDGDGY